MARPTNKGRRLITRRQVDELANVARAVELQPQLTTEAGRLSVHAIVRRTFPTLTAIRVRNLARSRWPELARMLAARGIVAVRWEDGHRENGAMMPPGLWASLHAED